MRMKARTGYQSRHWRAVSSALGELWLHPEECWLIGGKGGGQAASHPHTLGEVGEARAWATKKRERGTVGRRLSAGP